LFSLNKAHRHNLVEDFRNLNGHFIIIQHQRQQILREELIRYFGQTLDTVIWCTGTE
jgi:REP element-mobilizing transposase RayT